MKMTTTSIRYPPSIDEGRGQLALEKNYPDYVKQLIKQVLLTNPGERINRPDFGCGLRRMIFAPNSDVTANLTQVMIFQALETWLGDVIDVAEVKVQSVDEVLKVNIAYTLIALQERRYLNLEVTL